MKIRDFRSSDYDQIVKLWTSSGLTLKDVDSLSSIEKFVFENPGLFLVGEKDSEVIGTVVGAWDGRRGWIYHLAVHSDWQRLGLARKLMEQVEKNLKELGATQVNLLVETENAKVATFYQKVGYAGDERLLLKKKV